MRHHVSRPVVGPQNSLEVLDFSVQGIVSPVGTSASAYTIGMSGITRFVLPSDLLPELTGFAELK